MNHKFKIQELGAQTLQNHLDICSKRFVKNDKKVALHPYLYQQKHQQEQWSMEDHSGFEVAGPREKIYFDPRKVRVAIVSCGGLCPGINAVIRALVMHLSYRYKVKDIFGIKYGYQGLSQNGDHSFVRLHPESLVDLHETGGSFLGSSRGAPSAQEMLTSLADQKINILFTIGGDGTMRGARAISQASQQMGYHLSVIGVPKTIDNDIPYVKQSFGFDTAVSIAHQAIQSAHLEAEGYQNGIGMVKLMGRQSGYIAASATLAAGHVNFCLVPEVPFELEGKNGLFTLLEQRLKSRKHALIVVAEGAGQHFFKNIDLGRDASGNPKLANIGLYLKDRISEYFKSKHQSISMKYIDPSYLIRSAPANPSDQLFCARLAQNAVHAAMAGKTEMLIGYWHGSMTHVPLSALDDYRQAINPDGNLWFNVLETTGQPNSFHEF